MGLNHGGKIVTDGLVLMLDASNIKSYRGEPTTNLASNTMLECGWPGYYTLINSDTKTFRLTITDDWASGTDAWHSIYYDVSSYIGQTLTISSNFNFISATNSTFAWLQTGQGNTGGSPCFIGNSPEVDRTMISTTTPQHITWTGVINSAGIIGFSMWLTNMTRVANAVIQLSNVQVEVKGYETPFVNGTRGTTVATGGGWKDLSGNGNHGVVNNGEYKDGYLRNLGNVSNFFSISIDNSTSINDTFTQITGGWTIEEIIWTNSLTYPECDAGSVVSNDGYGSGKGFDWNHGYGSGDFKFEQIGGASNDTPAFSVPSPYNSLNVWRNRTMVWNRSSNTNSLYINGNFINSGSTPNTSGQIIYDGGGISLGTLYGWKHHGRRAGLKIYNRVLTSTEILNNFNAIKGRFGL